MKPWGFGSLFPAPSFLPHILLILPHTLSCSCLRLCFRKVAQVSLSAVELPDHLFVPALPASCLVFFFATKKKTRGRVTAPPIALQTTSSLFYLTPLVPCSSYYFAAPCSSCLVILINTVPGNSSSDSSPQGALHSCLSTHHYTSLRHRRNFPSVPDLPSPFTAPVPVRPFSLPSFSLHAPTCLYCEIIGVIHLTRGHSLDPLTSPEALVL